MGKSFFFLGFCLFFCFIYILCTNILSDLSLNSLQMYIKCIFFFFKPTVVRRPNKKITRESVLL